MIIRTMAINDYGMVYDLWLNTPNMGLNNLDDSKEGIGKYLERNPRTCFVAEKDSKIFGVILSGHDGRRGYMHHTAVKCVLKINREPIRFSAATSHFLVGSINDRGGISYENRLPC